MTTRPNPNPPTGTNQFGERRWEWADPDGDAFAIDEETTHNEAAVTVHAWGGGAGTMLTAVQCREAAAVLLALADEREASW